MTVTPQKPRIRILRTEPHCTIWRFEFGKPSNHRAVEAWMRRHPHVGAGPIDKRRMPG